MVVQRTPTKQSNYIPYEVTVPKPMNQEQFKQEASLQIFGRVLPNIKWRNLRSSYDKDKSPYTVSVDADLVRAVHGQTRREQGLAVGQTLRSGPVPTIELRASMIIGHGSLSWLIVRDLVARLPVMVLPAEFVAIDRS